MHRGLLERLPPVLRAYVGCAAALFGDLAQADVIKIHNASGKITFPVYDDFEAKRLPQLQHRIKVNLKTRWVQAFDHREEGAVAVCMPERAATSATPSMAVSAMRGAMFSPGVSPSRWLSARLAVTMVLWGS